MAGSAKAIAFTFSLLAALAAPAFAQPNVQFDPATGRLLSCPATVERAPSARQGERVSYLPVRLRPMPGWAPMLVGGKVSCEEFGGQDDKGPANVRRLIEHGLAQGVEYKIDYSSGYSFVSRGATGFKDVTLSNVGSKGPLWQLNCGQGRGGQYCSIDSLVGVTVTFAGAPPIPELAVNPIEFAKGNEIQWPATVRSGTLPPVQLKQFESLLPAAYLSAAMAANGYIEVTLKQRPKGSSAAFTDLTQRVELKNLPLAMAVLSSVVQTQAKLAAAKP